ncbi:fimbrial protein [Buttiauxella selenatireducens]|uniref:Fimbrial protein n=1 Tax=Buttiauxella selenatireducens TaxID=3073902 RepID=A0ABY9SAB5_9ENTR|nr:fimbrial protein [Buttiauxella sp. R73]WMY73386.1 fimbrial protein [Buttiauxella sp. R73]
MKRVHLPPIIASVFGLILFVISCGSALAASGLSCEIDTGGAAPFSPFTRAHPIAVDEDTPDYSVILNVDYAYFLPNMRLSCTTNGAYVAPPVGFDGYVTLKLKSVNGKPLNWIGEADTNNNGIKLKMFIKATAISGDTPPSSYPSAAMMPGKSLGAEYPIVNIGPDTSLVQFGAQHNSEKTQYKFDQVYNYAIESMRVELIKYGWVEYSELPVIPPGYDLIFTVEGFAGSTDISVPLGSGVYMAAPSCSLDNPHQTVELGSFSKRSGESYPLVGNRTLFGIGFTCSTFTSHMELTFDDAHTAKSLQARLNAYDASGGLKALDGVGIELYDQDDKPVVLGAQNDLGAFRKGATSVKYSAAIVQTADDITKDGQPFTGKITGKANVTISYY